MKYQRFAPSDYQDMECVCTIRLTRYGMSLHHQIDKIWNEFAPSDWQDMEWVCTIRLTRYGMSLGQEFISFHDNNNLQTILYFYIVRKTSAFYLQNRTYENIWKDDHFIKIMIRILGITHKITYSYRSDRNFEMLSIRWLFLIKF